eukprot:4454826-Pyramimonas_sp.AAC.1
MQYDVGACFHVTHRRATPLLICSGTAVGSEYHSRTIVVSNSKCSTDGSFLFPLPFSLRVSDVFKLALNIHWDDNGFLKVALKVLPSSASPSSS